MRKLLVIPLAFCVNLATAAPFDSCPADAFLMQGKLSQTYAVNLATGDYQVASEQLNVKKSVNAVGFNPADNFIYGWSYEHRVPVRIHADFTVEPLEVNHNVGKDFFVGDVHPENNEYYVYRKGKSYGLYRIQLDQTQNNYLQMEKIIDGESMALNIADFAINPADGYGYAIASNGKLHQFDPANGDNRELANTGISGTFGSAYFDIDQNLYVSRNNDGKIFRVNVASGNYTAEFFATGPASNTNDGARCALAAPPVKPVEALAMDFGDAPNSYGTTLDSDGARHTISDVYLGRNVDSESNSYTHPLSDDRNDRSDDEDGIQLATTIEEGRKAVIVVSSTGKGYLNGWLDLDADGEFNGHDQLITDVEITKKRQPIHVDIPYGVKAGNTWARFRLSSQAGLLPTGAANDGEVEDYQVKLREQQVTVNHYPSAKGWTTLAFEDNWPREGDFDMNDLVVYMRTSVAAKPNGISKVGIEGEIAAVGAAYHNGFAVRLPGVKYSQVDLENVRYTINGEPVKWAPIEGGREEAILMVTYNLWDYIGSGEHCLFYRTEKGCGSSIQLKFEAEIPMLEPVKTKLRGVLDPFLFATPGAWHGGHFASAPGRGYEIHLKNQAPTEAFDMTLFDQEGDDASDASRGRYFQTDNGLPWALEIGTRWEYPIEYHDISHAYPMFAKFASSGGEKNGYWYNKRFTNKTYIFEN